MTNQPHKRYEHVYAIVRFDNYLSDIENATSVVKCYINEEEAEKETRRLNKINSDKDCRYLVYISRLIPPGVVID